MKPKISIVVLVDAVGALSDRTLHDGNLSLVDDSPLGSRNLGTTDLVTAVVPGQVVQWTPIHVDVQTPVEIQNIEFLGAAPAPVPPPLAAPAAEEGAAVEPGYAAEPVYEADGPVLTLPDFPAAAEPWTGGPSALASNGFENHDLLVWEGIVPVTMVPGVPYRYRLSIKLHEGANSVLSIESPALLRV
ncbi:hypothetical protein LO762_25330 [Actinocorallia sp. API 0066]|uniref:hypothetical protein n=1 Tax=Actinocorallia sp. API 0066 TaxID=2896846 RepID=UPI001E4F3A9E|nr:hypothetical protein [Actinocorallia sp. API 0066]MCD0452481.1 hypothetical protein [Actinocorallia sp. API 0066]